MTYSLLDGRLTLTRDFQEGASGTRLWHGTHVQWGEVVIKTIRRPHDPADRSKRQGYFRDEVECGQIESPYVRRLLESGEIDSASELGYPNGIFYLVFERMQSSLEDVLRENTPALDEVRDLVWAIGHGLDAAHTHERPIVHRDLKPSNILLQDGSCGSAKVADFGIARMEGGTRLTSMYWVGTERYMAPEQFDHSSEVGPQADIYSFALLVWQCLTGEIPYDEKSAIATRDRRRDADPLGVLVVDDIERPAVSEVLQAALAADADERPSTALGFAVDVLLAGVADGLWQLNPEQNDVLASRMIVGNSVILNIEVEDRRPEGVLWVLGPLALGPILAALTDPDVQWVYNEHRGGWLTTNESIDSEHFATSLGCRELLEPEPPRSRRTSAPKKKRAPNPAFMRPMMPDEKLAAVVGNGGMPRTEITKRLWAYIKKNGLQDSKNRRMINADDKMQKLFGGKKQVSMFEMTKLANRHMR